MASGIKYSVQSAGFYEKSKDRVGRGAFETDGFYISEGVLMQYSKRQDNEIRKLRAGKSPDGSSALKRLMKEPETLYGKDRRQFRNSIKATGLNIASTPTHSNSFEQSQPQVPETERETK